MSSQQPSNQTVSAPPGADFKWLFGSDSTCDVCNKILDSRHMEFKRNGNRCFIRDLKSQTGTFLNGDRIKSRIWYEVSKYDDIKLGSLPFTIHPQVFFGRGLAGLDTTLLTFDVGGKKGLLCDGAYIRAKPRSITAVMGPSGAGKSVFLNLLNGFNRPTSGQVFVGGQFDVHGTDRKEALQDFIGFVPQAEVMIPELTVMESLCYRLRLRYPDIKRDFSERFARQVCSRLGFADDELTEFLNKRIGSPESRGKVLSGGQRRRANIAHELVCRTQVLILDEPTSGLSSVDADKIISLLYDLAKQDGLTIITTVHQPSRDSYSKFDDLLLMSFGGKIAYYGPADQAPAELEKASGIVQGQKNPAEYVLEPLENSGIRDKLTKNFSTRVLQPPMTPNPFSSPGTVCGVQPKAAIGNRFLRLVKSPFRHLTECRTLVNRNLRVLLSDRIHLLFTIGQVPLIAILVFLAFYKAPHDNSKYDLLAKRLYFFGQELEPYDRENKSGFNIDKALRIAAEKAKDEQSMISELTAKQRATIIFTLAVTVIWFGMMGSCKEIVTEQHIIRRECHSCIHLGPYVVAKMWVQMIFMAVQTGLLSVLTVPWVLAFSMKNTLHMWLVLWVAGIAASALGLLVSGLARTYRVALTAVPILLIPQLLFGGLLRPIVAIKGITFWPRICSYLTIQRWAFEAGLSVDNYARLNVLRQYIDLNATGKFSELKMIQFKSSSLVETFFGMNNIWNGILSLIILCCATMFFLILCHLVLKKRYEK
ncbi:MAG: ATP-binding cassette domain-containing protein [bacterium]